MVEETDWFKLRIRRLTPFVPRMRQVLRAVHLQLEHHAEANAINLNEGGPGNWVRKSPAGADAPEMWFYYSLTPSEACLEFVTLANGEPADGPQDTTAL